MFEIGPLKAFVCTEQYKQRINAASDVRTRYPLLRGAENCTGLE